MKKIDFSESHVEEMSKEPQRRLKDLFGKNHFGQFAYIEDTVKEWNDPMKVNNNIKENDDVPIENDEFDIFDIID